MRGKKEDRKLARKNECVAKALKQLPSKKALPKKAKRKIVIEVKRKDNASSKNTLIIRSLKDLPTSPMPNNIKPMRATAIKETASEEPFESRDWIYEIKWDGFRIAYLNEGSVQFRTDVRARDVVKGEGG